MGGRWKFPLSHISLKPARNAAHPAPTGPVPDIEKEESVKRIMNPTIVRTLLFEAITFMGMIFGDYLRVMRHELPGAASGLQ